MVKQLTEDFDFKSILDTIKDSVLQHEDQSTTSRTIPSILDFIYGKKYLNFTKRKIKLYPLQEVMLKIFYRGTEGNENLRLSDKEIKMVEDAGQDVALNKYHSDTTFRELVLVLGRRSGKGFVISIIALYEAMKLLECPGGSPFKYYGLDDGNPLFILTVATSGDQAKIVFSEMKSKLHQSDYFRSKLGRSTTDKIHLFTPEDRRKQKELMSQGLVEMCNSVEGSVVIMSGHSNSESLLGKSVFVLLLDEVASFKSSSGPGGGDRIYSALGPSQAAFTRNAYDENGNQLFDENGDPVKVLESKTISISSPRAEEGMLYKLYREAGEVENRLAFRLPTWKVNLSMTEEMLRREYKWYTPDEFAMEFGAQFSGTGGEKFIANEYVDKAFDIGVSLGQQEAGRPGFIYYAHLDPSSTSHNYALIVLHVEKRARTIEKNGRSRKEHVPYFVVDHIKCWQPPPGGSINVFEVDKYIINLARRFRFAMITYDVWNSLSSVQKLRAKGIPCKVTPFRAKYKMHIYDHLEHLMVNHQLALPKKTPYSNLLEMELKCLKRIYTPLGFKIRPDEEALVKTDDCCDALSGACASAIEHIYTGYAKGATVYMPQSQQGNNASGQVWNIGNASYGNKEWQMFHKKFGI